MKSAENIIFPQMFVWTGRMQFWQPRQTFPNEGQKIIAQCPELIEKHFLLKNTFSTQNILVDN